MKVLVATSLAQGTSPRDYHYCIDGELVWIQVPCDRDVHDREGPCGCGRAFARASSHRATTTATVVDTEMTRDDVVLAFQTSLSDSGLADKVGERRRRGQSADPADLPVGTIITDTSTGCSYQAR